MEAEEKLKMAISLHEHLANEWYPNNMLDTLNDVHYSAAHAGLHVAILEWFILNEGYPA